MSEPGYLGLVELRDFFAEISYRPGWSFTVRPHDHEGPHLHIDVSMADSTNPAHMVPLNIISPLPPVRHVWQLEDWLIWRLERIESHEVREWLQRGGKPIRNPHDGVERT